MKRKERNIFFGIPKIIVLLVYLPFFLVQGFFNYYSPAQYNKEQVKTNNEKTVSYLKGTTLHQVAKVTGNQSNIRLNKRFQPASTPLCIIESFELPCYYKQVKLFYNYPDPHLPSFHLLTKTLRGPPAVV
jgi:hypothetical protein